MKWDRVCVEALGYVLPPERWTSDDIEARLRPVYQRLRLPEGRLELMTGVRERRVWPVGTLTSDRSRVAGELALAASKLPRKEVGAIIHASVCRDHLEPATACRVHHLLGLRSDCVVHDLSNACLGLLNGMLHAANMIQAGQIRAGLVVGTESSRPLLETTIAALNADAALTRDSIKDSLASLTIGSGSAAILLVDRGLSQTGNLLTTAVVEADTRHHGLCQSGRDEAIAEDMRPQMRTDAETLMHAGVETAKRAFAALLRTGEFAREDVARSVCHQVGKTHRRLMLAALGLGPEHDFETVEWLGNTGSVALPTALALAAEQGFLATDAPNTVALLGIGSGINCVMAAVNWRHAAVRGVDEAAA